MKKAADKDLRHFLKLALAQTQHRIGQTANRMAGDAGGSVAGETLKLRMLEELIKEQVPNENTHSPTRASR